MLDQRLRKRLSLAVQRGEVEGPKPVVRRTTVEELFGEDDE